MNYSRYPNEAYTVGWICVLPIEYEAARGMMEELHGAPQTKQVAEDPNVYSLGNIGNFKVVIASSPRHQTGPVSAAIIATSILHTFPNIRFGLLVGIGGGIPGSEPDPRQDLRLGDVVIGRSTHNGGVIMYDFGKSLSGGSFQPIATLNRPPRWLDKALTSMRKTHARRPNKILPNIQGMLHKYPGIRKSGFVRPDSRTDRLFKPEYPHSSRQKTCFNCDPSKTVPRGIRRGDMPIIHYGIIASGGAVIKNPMIREAIRRQHGAKCIEMEAAGVIRIFPCIMIRGISDYADSHKNDQWHPFAAASAAACAKELLEHVKFEKIGQGPLLPRAGRDHHGSRHEKSTCIIQ